MIFKMAQDSPRYIKMAPKMPQEAPRPPQGGSKKPNRFPRMPPWMPKPFKNLKET